MNVDWISLVVVILGSSIFEKEHICVVFHALFIGLLILFCIPFLNEVPQRLKVKARMERIYPSLTGCIGIVPRTVLPLMLHAKCQASVSSFYQPFILAVLVQPNQNRGA